MIDRDDAIARLRKEMEAIQAEQVALDARRMAAQRTLDWYEAGCPGEAPGYAFEDMLVAGMPAVRLCDEIMGDLPEMLKRFPKGPTTQEIADRLGCEYVDARNAVLTLLREGRALFIQRHDSKAHHLVPLGYDGPKPDLTRKQAAALQSITAAARDDGTAQISLSVISTQSRISRGAIVFVLDALVKKGRISILKPGRGTSPAIYRVENIAAGKVAA